MQLKEWKINKSDEDKPLIERLLFSRGIKNQKEKEDFLNPLSIKLTHPNAFCDMPKAVERISKAIDNNENILIYGDFDADGLTSTSLLVKTLTYLNANVSYFIPAREGDGHGLNNNALVKLMVSKRPKLIITVDCGISNIEEVKFINSFNIDVILTDHHEAPEELPQALAIINPKAPNSLDEKLTPLEINYLTSLAGVGVAFKLAQAVLEKYDKLAFLYDILPYVAVGTVADIVPLIGENRYFVLKGLDLIAQGKHYGLKRLLDNAGYSNIDEGITAEQVAFGIAPRINASGRLDAVDDALKVLISDNRQEIEMAVIALENYNKIRQDLCHSTFLEADEMAKNDRNKNAIVLFKPDWHIGIIGIVASKIVEKYHKPAFLMMYSEETKQIRCSARGVEGVAALSLYDIISNIADKLDGFGGHTLAAGFSFNTETTSFEDVKKRLTETVDEALAGEKIVPVLNIDMELKPDDVSVSIIDELKRLEPYGAANPQPLFILKDLILKEKKLMGSNKEHLKLIFEKDGQVFNAIWWSKGDITLSSGDIADIAFSPQINTFNGNTTVQLILKDLHSESLVEEEIEDKIKIYDHRSKVDIFKQVNDYLQTTKLDTVVFAEDKSVIEQLKPYPEILKRVLNRNTIRSCNSLMFFDYPASGELYELILTKSSPSTIHYMNYTINHNIDNYLKTISGMIRFVCNNKQGVFEFNSSATFLGVTEELIQLSLEMFAESGFVSIVERNDNSYTLKFLEHGDITNLETLASYTEFNLEYTTIKSFKQSYQNIDLQSISVCAV